MRHLIILDMRDADAFATSNIRRSINVTIDTFESQLIAAMLAHKSDRFMSHYPSDDLKRVLFVLPAG